MDIQDRINQLYDKIEELKMQRENIDTEIDEIEELIEDLKSDMDLSEKVADTGPVQYQNYIRANINRV